MMIEQIPLSLELQEAMMVSPALIGVFGHENSLEVPRSQRILRHGIGQCLRATLMAHPREGEVIPSIALEHMGAFLESLGKSLHYLSLSIQFLHVALQSCATDAHARPIEIGLAIVVNKYRRINAAHASYGRRLAYKRSLGPRSRGHANSKAPTLFRCRGEVEIVLPVLADTLRGPHGIAIGLHPGHLVLRNDYTMVLPVDKIGRREDVIVGHAEPILTLPLGGRNVVRRVEIHPVAKKPCCRVGTELIMDNRILSHAKKRHGRQ